MAHKWLPVFGQSIDFVLKQQEYAHPHEKVPYFVSQALRMVRLNGLTEEAIGRAAASNDAIEGLKRALNAGPINLAEDERARDPHVCIAFVKKYLSELPDTLIPRADRSRLWATKTADDLKRFLGTLPPANVELLRALVALFYDITLNAAMNKMTTDQAAKMLGPLLVNFNSLAEYTSTSNAAQLLVTQYSEIFAEAADVKAKLVTSPVATMRKLYGHKKAILSMCYSATEKRVWTGDAAGVLCSWDADQLKIVGEAIVTGPAAILALLSSGANVVAACVNSMQIYNSATRKKVRDVATNVCYMTEASGRIWTGGQGSLVRIFDNNTCNVVKEFSFEQGNSVRSMATDSNNVWVASTDRCIRVFKADTYEQIKEFKAHSRAPLSIEPIPDLGQVWTTSDDKSVRVWNARDQALVGELIIPTAKAYGVVSLGGQVLTYGWDRAFLLADVQSIKIDGQVDTPHTDAISVVLVRNNERLGISLLWSASWDQSVCVSAVRTSPVPSPASRIAGQAQAKPPALAASSQRAPGLGGKGPGSSSKGNGEKPVWQLSAPEIVINANTPILGKGTFGTVYKAVLRGQPVAVKKFFTQSLDETLLEDFRNEVVIMSALSHPNVLLFMGACFEPGNLIIVTELMPKGNVEELLYRKEGPPPLPMRMRMARDAAQGMTWLHCSRPPFLHLDLKPANLLVDDNYVVKVADFGFALIKQTKHDPSSPQPVAKGTPIYAAPEVLLGKTFDEKADVFSFAMVLWEMYTCEYPWANTTSLKDHVRNVCVKNERPPLHETCPQSLREAIQAMWHIVPEKRPSFEDILPRFEAILIESTLLHDVGAVRFWKAYFPEEQSVPFPRFAQDTFRRWLPPALMEYFSLRYATGADDVHIKCMAALVSPNNSRVVTLEQFSNVVEWCGPFTEQFISRVHDLLKLAYFHGDLSAADAQRLMANDKKGSWVLRFSSKPGDFTITVKGENNTTTNYRLEKVKGGYVFGKTQHPSLADALSVYKKDLGLKSPVGGSKFEPLFAKKNAANDQPQDAYSEPDVGK